MRTLTATVSAFALVTTMMSSPAIAFTIDTATIDDPIPEGASATTQGLMQDGCTAKAAVHGVAWSGTLADWDDGTVTSGPSVAGDPVIDEESVTGVGVPIPESFVVTTEPFRIGGSPNMFGFGEVVAAHYPDSEYDFTQAFTWVSTYNYTCHMTETVQLPATGHHDWTLDPSDPQAAACLAYDRNGLFQGLDQGQCVWIEDSPGGPDEQDRPDEYGSITQNEGGDLNGHESSGGPIPVDPEDVGDLDPVQVVVCISPSDTGAKRPGAWQKKNGYTGSNCTTLWYNDPNGGMNQPDPYDNLNTGSNNVVTIPTA
jgi:hypothetical protein